MSDAATAGPGAIVRAQRESLGLSRQNIADTLNLSQRVVENMEAEIWASLPTAAFTRGYFRAYAKLLDLDPDTVTSAFDLAAGRTEVRTTGAVAAVHRGEGRIIADLMQKHPGAVLTGAVAVVICAVLIVLLAVWPDSSSPAGAAGQPSPAIDTAAPRFSLPNPNAKVAAKASGDGTHPASAQTATNSVDAGAQNPLSAMPPRPNDSERARRITSDGDDLLNFSFTEDCWVEIKDARGVILFGELGKSGDELEIVGRRPFHILLGNAPAVTLAFNGERVTLAPHTRNNVGTLVLGQ